MDEHATTDTAGIPSTGVGTDDVTMVLWTRRPVCGPKTDVIDRLSRLRTEESIEDFTVETWPDEVAMSEHTEESRVVDVYKEYLLWAEEHDLTITPPFERREASTLVGEHQDVLRMPMLCLAVYQDGLQGVYPCTRGDRTWRVEDYLDAFEAAEGRPVSTEGDEDVPLLEA